jgi:hypothetical protein
MGLIFRKRVKIDGDTAVNVSNSGLSTSKRIGRRLTLNSRGGGSFRIAPGLSWRFGRRRR